MAAEPPETGVGAFPPSDQFPLDHGDGRVGAIPGPASALRPFGLTLAVAAPTVVHLDRAELDYDDEAQLGVIRTATGLVPLCRHTTGQTATVTQGGDGHGTNRDSDTDHRED